MRKIARYVIVILCIALALSGCASNESQSASTQLPGGGGQSPAASSSSMPQTSQQGGGGGQMIEPKQLISKVEAAQLLGEPVKDGMTDEKPALGMKICFYAAENSASKSYLQIAVVQSAMLPQGQGQGQGQPQTSASSGTSSQPGAQGGGQSSNSPQASQGSSGGGEQLTPKALYEALKQSMEDLNSAETGRIGDDNFRTAQGMGILSGEYYIYVSAGSNDPAAIPGIVKAAGEMSIRNLKRIQGE